MCSACNDKTFLGQLEADKGTIYVFDKGYANYGRWSDWDREGGFFVTRQNENASTQVLDGTINHISEYADGGVISDRTIKLSNSAQELKVRVIVYKDPESGKFLKFVNNMFAFDALTIVQLYKYRWNIEVLFYGKQKIMQSDIS